MKKKNKIRIKISEQHNMNYVIIGMSNAEYKALQKEFDSEEYQSYNGIFSPWKVWDNLEVIWYLSDKYEAKELTEYKQKYHPACTESCPFILNDGRVIFLTLVSATLYDSVEQYAAEWNKWSV